MLLVPVKKPFELPTEGAHKATIVEVRDGGIGKSKHGNGRRKLLTVIYRIEDQKGADGKNILLPQNITFAVQPAGLHIKQSEFHRLLTVGLGVVIDPKSEAFDAETIVGRTLNIKVQHKIEGNAVFADIVDYPKSTTRRAVVTVVDDVIDVSWPRTSAISGGDKCQS